MTISATTVSVSFGIETNNAEAGPSTLPIDIQPFPPIQITTEAESGRLPFEAVHSNVSIVSSHPSGGTVTTLPQRHIFENLDITTGYFDSKLVINTDQKYIYTQPTTSTIPIEWEATEVNIISHGQSPALDFLGTGGQVTYTLANHENTVGEDGAGEAFFDTSGAHTWTAPAGVTSVSVVAIGGGGGGGQGTSGEPGGGGGGLGWKNNISVTAGQTYNLNVGAAGVSSNTTGTNGGDSYFIDTTTVKGGGGGGSTGSSHGTGGTYVGDGGGNGGDGGPQHGDGGGGGGAGGYSGNGGAGGPNETNGYDGSGGGGGGGSSSESAPYNGGGGVNPYGEGTSGVGGTVNTTSANEFGKGGSGGEDGTNDGVYLGHGGKYGGGGGGSDSSYSADRSKGAVGCVRILWGTNRSFPSTSVSSGLSAGSSTTQVTDPQPVFSYSSFPSNLGIERILTNKSIITSGISYAPTIYPNIGVTIQTNGSTRAPITNDMNNLSVTTKPLGYFDTMPTTVPTINTTLKSDPSIPKSINVSKDVTFGAPSFCNSVSQTILIANTEPLGFFTEDGISFFAELTDQNDPRLTSGTSSGGGEGGGEGGEGGGSGSGPVQSWSS